MRYSRRLAFLLLISCMGLKLWGQMVSAVVEGRVRLESGSPLPNAIISAYLLTQEATGYTANIVSTTDDKGAFRMKLNYGNYIFLVTKGGARLYQGTLAVSAPQVNNLIFVVNDPCTNVEPLPIYERTYLQVPDDRFHNDLFVYIGDHSCPAIS